LDSTAELDSPQLQHSRQVLNQAINTGQAAIHQLRPRDFQARIAVALPNTRTLQCTLQVTPRPKFRTQTVSSRGHLGTAPHTILSRLLRLWLLRATSNMAVPTLRWADITSQLSCHTPTIKGLLSFISPRGRIHTGGHYILMFQLLFYFFQSFMCIYCHT
jgi:hypothetical protein